jgi:hypothetical protein
MSSQWIDGVVDDEGIIFGNTTIKHNGWGLPCEQEESITCGANYPRRLRRLTPMGNVGRHPSYDWHEATSLLHRFAPATSRNNVVLVSAQDDIINWMML